MTLILLVDDEPLITDSLSYSLKREGFEVEMVTDGLSALEAVERLNPDLIVLDLMLPDISGFEVCRRLRSTTNTPVIMLTARGEEIDRVLGLEVGADDYLAKPFSFRELLAHPSYPTAGGIGSSIYGRRCDGTQTVESGSNCEACF